MSKGTGWRRLLGMIIGGAYAFSASCANAQITPDNTLPNNSNVTINGSVFNITGGTQAGGNLFHSFQQFSVPTGGTASFNNGLDIQNIFSRVTGGSVSNINGIIQANGTANLFFLNPSGIIFGRNASLNIGGSFVATTANAIGFGNQGFFSASNPNNPALLRVNPSALLFNQIAATALIQNNSQARVGGNVVGLQVPNGKSLLLVGGNVNLDGGGLTASGGRVELAGLAAPGTVGLNVAGDSLSLSVPSDVQLADVSLSNQASVNVFGAGAGDIAINARNLRMSNSYLFAGIGIGLGNGSTKAGNINITADAISLTDGAQITSFTGGKGDAGDILITAHDGISLDNQSILGSLALSGSEGNAGNINIITGSLSATNGGGLGSTIAGKGNASNVTINARDAVSFNGVDSSLLSNVQAGAVGNGGNINITAGSLSLTNGGYLSTGVNGASGNLTGGQGQGGTVNLNLRDALTISGANSGIFANLNAGAVGRGGDINIQAGNVFVRDGGQINSFTSGTGNAGNVTMIARDAVSFDGVDSNGNPSSLSSEVEAGAVGDGGNINITAGALSLTNSGYLSTGVREAFNSLAGGQGQGGTVNLNVRDALTISGANSGISASLKAGAVGRGGDINIQAGNLFVRDGGQINSFTSGKGNAGNITIIARNAVTFDGVDSNGNYSSLSSDVAPGGVGSGGKIDITAGSLSLTNGAELSTDVYGAFNTLPGGQGQGGTINLNLRDALTISGANSGIFANLDAGAVGRGGDINIQAGNVFVKDGGQINSFTSGTGNAGNVTMIARDAVSFDGVDSNGNPSSLSSEVEAGAVGDGGNINITAGALSLTNSGYLSTGVREAFNSLAGGQGQGGTVNLNVRDALTISGANSGISASLKAGAVGRGGDINIQAGNLFVRDGGQINSFTSGKGNAGNITIIARNAVTFDGVDSNGNYSSLSSDVAPGGVGSGGKIDITAGSLSLTDGAELSNAASEGRGGDINIQAGNIFVKDGGQIISSTFGKGDAGKISIATSDGIFLDGTSYIASNVQSNTAQGSAGNIDITTGSLSATHGAEINSFTRGQGNAGDVTINAKDSVTFDGVDSKGNRSASASTVEAGAVGKGGNINITASSLSLTNGGYLTSSVNGASGNLAGGQGTGGTVNLSVGDALTISGTNSGIFADLNAGAVGRGGNINIQAGNVFVKNGGQIISSTFGKGDGGNISITANNGISLDGASYIVSNVQSNTAQGNGGNIDIATDSLLATHGAQINAFTRGQGSAGNVTITARDAVTFDGVGSNGFPSASLSYVDAGGVGNGGKINITAGSLSLTNGAELNSSINGTSGNLTGGKGIGGIINLNLHDALTISGTNSGVFANLNAGAVGRAGDINIQAGDVFVKNGSQINSFTRGTGNAGNVTIIAKDAVTFDGVDSNGNSSGSLSDVEPGGVGNGGNITIKTRTLTTRSSNISTTTKGNGDAGNLTILASDSVDLSGDSYNPLTPASGSPGGLLAQVDGLGQGKGGNLYIETGRLSISDGSKVQVATLGNGNAGNLFIHADEIDVFNTGKPYFFPTSISGGVLIDKRVQEGIGPDPRNGKPPTGNGGTMTIETHLLNVINGGQITSSSVAQGKAGDINITADIARLNNGQIIAQTNSSDGGNINFNLSQYLLLRNGSQISATAGTAQKGGDGGNITINSKFIIAVPEENSDITANAFTGKGGSVLINTQGIFGTQFRSQLTPESDITASSTFGVSGIVNINTPDTSFLQNSLTQLPQNLINTNVLIANSCITRSRKQQGTFTITGSGGLPNRPGDASVSSYPTGTVRNVQGDRTSRPWHLGDPIVEPQGVYRLPSGQLVLSRECGE